MLRCFYRAADGRLHAELPLADLGRALQDRQGLLWLDMDQEAPESCRPILHDVFRFHPLAIEDALEQSHVPKLDDWGDYLYLVLHAVCFAQAGAPSECAPDVVPNFIDVTTLELDIFAGRNYMVTYHKDPMPAVDALWLACERDRRHLERGMARLLYDLTDALAAGYMPVVDRLDEILDQIEDEVFLGPDGSLLARAFALKRALVHLRRIIAPQREVLNKLARGDYALISRHDGVFFRDVYDHMVRLYDIVDGLRDLVGDALETYLSVINNRMNEVVKALTIITTLFMPISFLASFFGMNFFEPAAVLRPWTTLPPFALVMATMVLLPVFMLWWLRRRAWM